MENTLFSLQNKAVILTGGLGLLGKYFARYLIAAGARVILLDMVPSEGAIKRMQDWFTEDEMARLAYYEADITNESALMQVQKKIEQKFPAVHVLINNAALNPAVIKGAAVADNHFEKYNLAEWQKSLDVNVTGTMLCCKVFGSAMQKGGSIINMASLYGFQAPDQRIYSNGFIKPISYSVTKGAVLAMTKYLAAYWGEKGIRVNSLSPGGILADQDEEFIKKYSAKVPFGRMGNVEELAGMIVYLSSDASSYTTGANMIVDGGISIW